MAKRGIKHSFVVTMGTVTWTIACRIMSVKIAVYCIEIKTIYIGCNA